jgi:PEP-CTERM motif
MRKLVVLLAMLLVTASLSGRANASTFDFSFAGPGVSGTIMFSYGTATDAKYSNAFEVTGISGTFSDSNNSLNIVNAPILSLEPINYATPDPTNLLAPHDFSKFAVASGLPPQNNGVLTYDNLFWPGGSPQTASDYPLFGGFLDIYGLMFDIGGGTVVDLWSNGSFNGKPPIDYGVAVATSSTALDYVSGGVAVSPEPGTLILFGSGIVGLAGIVRRKINL